ncbi:MAG: hypothetical protein QM784_25835 [Polyangiaceae bacterium]
MKSRKYKGDAVKKVVNQSWREKPVNERIAHALVHGIVDHIEADCEEARLLLGSPLSVIEGPMIEWDAAGG